MVVDDVQPLAKHGTNQHSGGVDNVNNKTQGGTGAEYLLRRNKNAPGEPFRRTVTGSNLLPQTLGKHDPNVADNSSIMVQSIVPLLGSFLCISAAVEGMVRGAKGAPVHLSRRTVTGFY